MNLVFITRPVPRCCCCLLYTSQNVGAVGAAVVVAVGLGLLPSLDEAKRMVPAKKTFTPNPAVKPIYDRNYAVFQELYKANKKNFAALNG